MSLEKGLVFI